MRYCSTTLKLYTGNQGLHDITEHGLYELRIDMWDFGGNTRYAKYNDFKIGSEAEGFKLTFGGYNGDAGKIDNITSTNYQLLSKHVKGHVMHLQNVEICTYHSSTVSEDILTSHSFPFSLTIFILQIRHL